MLRFASSPTRDMRISDLREALVNYIVSEQKNEDFIVRILDIDKKNNINGKDKENLGLLDLFDIKYSQVIYQSESVKFHTAMALQLMHDKKAFSCFCSNEWLDKKKKEAQVKNELYRYDDACANLPYELVIDNTNPFRIRIKGLNKGGVDSFVILNQDKSPRSNFSCAVDDMLNNISIVVGTKDTIGNTAKQEYVRKSLEYDKQIQYIYLPEIIIDEHNEPSVKWLLEEGFLPSAISNYLISIGIKTPKDIFNIEEALEWFDLSNISKAPALFSMDALRDINTKHLINLNSKELSRFVGFADEEIGDLARVYLLFDNVSTTKQLKHKIATIFGEKNIPDQFKEQASLLKSIIKSAPYFDNYDEFNHYIMKDALDAKDYTTALRYVLTGSDLGPDIEEIYKYIKNYIAEIVR